MAIALLCTLLTTLTGAAGASAVQHGAVQHGAAQHGAAQHGAAQQPVEQRPSQAQALPPNQLGLSTGPSEQLSTSEQLSQPEQLSQSLQTDRAHITITEITPVAATARGQGDVLTLRGTVTNDGSSPIINASVAPREALLLSSRSAVDAAMSREGFSVSKDGRLVRGNSVDVETIAPGNSRSFTLEVPLSELGLGTAGAYQVTVALTGQTEAQQWDQVLGAGRTVLPWAPDSATADGDAEGRQTDPSESRPTVELTVLWPLISGTHLAPQTEEGQAPVFRDDTLLNEISPGGRLHKMITLGSDLPVTWVIDPDLLASVDAMAEDHQVQGPDGPVTGQGQEVARAFLHDLREAVQDREVIALPFADPDLASLAHRGKDVPGALGQLKDATEAAAVTVDTVLDVTASTEYAWPIEGAVDPDIVSVATSAGASKIIARSDSVVAADALSYTPTAARPIGGGITALVADSRLSQLFQGDMSRAGNVSLSQQLLLADTLTIAQQAPSLERSIVLAPQRMPNASQVQAMADALTTLDGEAGWVRFLNLGEAAQSPPDAQANDEVPPSASYPEHLRKQELPAGAFQSMRTAQRTLDDFTVILTRADRVEVPFGSAIRREMSTSWRESSGDAARFRTIVQQGLKDLTQQVGLIQKTTVTLSGRSATIPVTVKNDLLQEVDGLELRLTSGRRLGLEVSEPRDVTVGAGHSQSVKFDATARANGRTLLEAQLYTADGKRYGEPIRFHVEVTSITSAVMMVIAGGLLLVVLAGVRMYTQRRRAAQHAPAGETRDDTGDGSDPPGHKGEKLDRSG